MSDTNKHFKFNLDRKLKSWLEFEPNFLTWLPNDKLEKTTMYLLFSLFIQFSAIEIRWVFSRAKLVITSLEWLENEVGCPCSLVSYSYFSTDSSISRQIRHVFSMRVHEGALIDAINYAQKGCAMQMWGITLTRDRTLRSFIRAELNGIQFYA